MLSSVPVKCRSTGLDGVLCKEDVYFRVLEVIVRKSEYSVDKVASIVTYVTHIRYIGILVVIVRC